MQAAKDSFYMALRTRLAGLNPTRTMVIDGVTVPAIVVRENLEPRFVEAKVSEAAGGSEAGAEPSCRSEQESRAVEEQGPASGGHRPQSRRYVRDLLVPVAVDRGVHCQRRGRTWRAGA